MTKRKTIRSLQKLYEKGTPITMVTCYDYSFARLVEKADIDAILVGDSLGNVIQGRGTTLPVTLEDIIYHTRAVGRGNQSAHLIADMPFGSYQVSDDDGMRNAVRLLKETEAQAVKLEGGEAVAPLVARMVAAGIPVCGHLGFTPQSVNQFGGFRVQGRGDDAGQQLLADARALQDAGAYMVVFEMVPQALAREVTQQLHIPTIGIGAGKDTSGQVLVLPDLLGMNQDFCPKFVKRFENLEERVVNALNEYGAEVRERTFPADEHSFD